MKSLTRVKEKARELRASACQDPGDLFDGLVAELDKLKYKVRPVDRDIISGADAVLSVADKKIRYDCALDDDSVKRLLVIAHEAGHVLLHKHRLDDTLSGIDALSPYFNTGGPALARYNRRSREEIEADAFANEFACPSDEVFQKWLTDPCVTSTELASEYKVSGGMMLSRLAEGLFEAALTKQPEAEPRETKPGDDDDQKKAALHFGSPALVNAGPGTGKTATLITRTRFILSEKEAAPKSLLILTFSNEAAEELRARIEKEFGHDVADQIEITTFHGFGHAALLDWNSGLERDFIVLDESRQEELVFDLLGKVDCDPIFTLREPLETARNCVRQITKLKEKRITPDDLELRIEEWEKNAPADAFGQTRSRAFLAVFRSYENAKAELNSVDFADLINIPLELLEQNPALVEALRKKHTWVMVDEYQDVSLAVAQLLGKICGSDNPPWVVGDLRQAIYVFCGAAPQNVTNFPNDFAGAKIFELGTNYRSCDEVIDLANQLAEIIEPTREEDTKQKLWTRGSDASSLEGEEFAIKVAMANSDAAEYDGIADQVQDWMKLVKPEEIAVLARRNKDVRKVAIELTRRGINVATPGLVSTDGAAGLLSCVAAYVDAPKAARPRVAYALNAGRYELQILDRVVEVMSMDTLPDLSSEAEGVEVLVIEITRLERCLGAATSWGDGFTMICSFLFDGSDYLRRVLVTADEAKRSIEISEILSALAWAVAYRYSHIKTAPTESRIGFAQFFRGILATGRPALVPPHPVSGSVQVMTCHASKGLEFPCVAVTGQTLSLANDTSWLPPGIESKEEDLAQADSLFFVGVTRAQRSLLISYALTPKRKIPSLLGAWLHRYGVIPAVWERAAGDSDSFTYGAVWGLPTPRRRIAATTLNKDWCGMKVYLQDIYGGRFRTVAETLYPSFFAANRNAIGEILTRHGQGLPISGSEAEGIFISHFSDEKFTAHPLYEPYKRRGIRFATGLAAEIRKIPRPAELLETDELFGGEIGGDLLALRFGLTAHFRDAGGNAHAIIFRPEPIDVKSGTLEIPWSKLKKPNGLPVLMLSAENPQISPWVFSGEDGTVYALKWKQAAKGRDSMAEATDATVRRRMFSAGQFDGKASDFNCETMCDNRANCPYWMKQNMGPTGST